MNVSYSLQAEYAEHSFQVILEYFRKAAVFVIDRISRISAIQRTQEQALQQEKMASVEQALNRYGTIILRLAYSYVHNMNDAEDILQETLIKYMQASPAFESESHEKAWLLRVASNLSKNKIKYNKIRETDELEENLVSEERDDLSFVWEVVKSLPEKYREVIHLYYQEGYSSKEIAAILNHKESSVRTNLKRGREKLKEILKEAYDFE